MRRCLIACALVVAGCAPAHMKAIGLSGSGRELPELFLGGWDGKRLGVFDDTQVEPGVTTRTQLARALANLSSDQYAVVYVEKAKLDASAEKHGLFCESPMCLVVFDRKGGSGYDAWGETIAVFELKGAGDEPVGNVWLQAKAIRPPGPSKWERLCKSKQDTPKWVHPDGGALYPARPGPGGGFALFGPREEPASYRSDGFAAPSDTLCDEDAVRAQAEPEPERPKLTVDPKMLEGK